MFQTKVVQKIKTHILRSIILPDNRAVYDITSYSQRRHRWQYNVGQKKDFFLIQLTGTCSFNNRHKMHCRVSTATMVTRTRHNVKLHVHCLSCSVIMPRPALKPMQPPNQWIPGAISVVVKQLEREADHSLLFSAEGNNELWG